MDITLELLLNKTTFTMGCPTYSDLPDDTLVEIAIAGRSNAGKSTLINNLTQQNKLARVSQTPGKTREINLFNLYIKNHDPVFARLVDLPGYGYAKVGKALKASWQQELTQYLTTRTNLKILLVILDSRMPPTDLDRMLIEMVAKRNLQQIFIFNKVDKLNQSQKSQLKHMAEKLSYNTPNSSYIFYSSPKHIGKEELKKEIEFSLRNYSEKNE